jgi:hypothetical protein
MSNELERRLEDLLLEAPEPDPGVGEEALRRALAALQPAVPAPRRALRTGVLALAAAAALLAIAAGSLAAAGALHVSFGHKAKPLRPLTQLALPEGANGVAAVVDGKLSVVTRSGFRLQGLRVSAAALSPHALYVAAGVGDSLVAMAPDGRQAWSHPAGGNVVAIAWAPFGNRIAYIVRAEDHFVLHVIWGNGANDAVVDSSVRAVRPSWRADSLAVAYVGAGGRAVVYDVGHESRTVVPVRGPVTGLAFAPSGDSLAVEQPSDVWLLHQSAATRIPGAVGAIGWENGRLVVAGPAAVVHRFAPTGAALGSSGLRGVVVAVTPVDVVVREGRNLVAGRTTLLTVPRGAAVQALEIG